MKLLKKGRRPSATPRWEPRSSSGPAPRWSAGSLLCRSPQSFSSSSGRCTEDRRGNRQTKLGGGHLFFFLHFVIPPSLCPHPLLRLVQHVHGPLVDVPLQLAGPLLQLLQPLTGLPGVVELKVVGRVWLPEEVALWLDPVVFLQHPRHLEEEERAKGSG